MVDAHNPRNINPSLLFPLGASLDHPHSTPQKTQIYKHLQMTLGVVMNDPINPYRETRITFTAGTAFKAGFFGAFGILAAWTLTLGSIILIGWLIALLIYTFIG